MTAEMDAAERARHLADLAWGAQKPEVDFSDAKHPVLVSPTNIFQDRDNYIEAHWQEHLLEAERTCQAEQAAREKGWEEALSYVFRNIRQDARDEVICNCIRALEETRCWSLPRPEGEAR